MSDAERLIPVRAGLRPRATMSVMAQALTLALFAACFALFSAAPAAAQPLQPIVAAAPATPEFMSRYDFRLSIFSLMPATPTPAPAVPDERFSWDSHFGGSFDFADLVVARLGVIVDYQAVMGSEYRPFDPNQGNYTLEGFVSARVAPDTEVAGIFHHVSRHLSDRPKAFAVAYNEIGGRLMRHQSLGRRRSISMSRAAAPSSIPTSTTPGWASCSSGAPPDQRTARCFRARVGAGVRGQRTARPARRAGWRAARGRGAGDGPGRRARGFCGLREAGGRRSAGSPVPAMGPGRIPPVEQITPRPRHRAASNSSVMTTVPGDPARFCVANRMRRYRQRPTAATVRESVYMVRFPLALAAAMLAAGIFSAATQPALAASRPPKLQYELTTLPNGLTVVLSEDHSTPIVHVQLVYHVGSKNERPGRTGFAHLFEHLMFKGLEERPARSAYVDARVGRRTEQRLHHRR